MKKIILMMLLLINLSFMFSCGVTDAPFEHQYVIDIVLQPKSSPQLAFIDSTYRLDEPVDEDLTGISGASVFVVSGSGDTFSYAEVETIMGEYHSEDMLWVQNGMEYSVNVACGGDTISQTVSVPGTLSILYPFDYDTVSLSNPPVLVWNTCEGCYENNYLVYAYILGEADSVWISLATPDTMLGIFYVPSLFEETDTLYTIAVLALDEYCYNASKGWQIIDEIEDERAIGIIGASVMDSVIVYVRE
jgi:hypothetical protein